MIVSTQGEQAGAVLIEWNLASPSSMPSGMWDVHARIDGFAGSDLQVTQCPTTPYVATPPASVNNKCIAAFLTMHVTPSATGLYMENVWLWTADHDVEDANLTQITYTQAEVYMWTAMRAYCGCMAHQWNTIQSISINLRTHKPLSWGRFRQRHLTTSMFPKIS
jgi:hypothetical protein